MAVFVEPYLSAIHIWYVDGNFGGEIGPALLLPNGDALFFGGHGETAIYNYLNAGEALGWRLGAQIPNGLTAAESPAAMLVNGKVLCVAGPQLVDDTPQSPTSFFEYDPTANSFGQVNAPGGPVDNLNAPAGYQMLDLPDGTVLCMSEAVVNNTIVSVLHTYRPNGTPLVSAKPAITGITCNAEGNYHLTGTLLNGVSVGASYGDDYQMDSNYPLVRLSDTSGNVFYARTYGWSSTGVMTETTPQSTQFALPANLPAGCYSLVVVANGISSDPVSFCLEPTLSLALAGANAVLSWPAAYPGYALETTASLSPPAWTLAPGTSAIVDGQDVLSVGRTAGNQFFRLAAYVAGSGLSFDGVASYVSVGAAPLAPPWTAEFWVKRQDAPNYSGSLLGDASTALKLEQFNFTRKVGFTQFGVADYTFNYSAPANTWVHLAFVCDTTTRLYVNGALQDTMSTTMPLPLGRIGYDSSGHPDFLKGSLDEVRVWNVARTQAQIQTGMNHSLAVPQAHLAAYWRFDEGSGTSAFDSSGLG